MPIAALGRIKVVSLDYRQGPSIATPRPARTSPRRTASY